MSYTAIQNEVPEIVSNNSKPIMPKRMMPVITDRLELNDKYEGWWFVARVNPKMELFNMLMRGTYDGMVTALSQLTVGEWNFVDENGEDLPQPHLTRQNYEKWQEAQAEAEKAGDKAYDKWRNSAPISPQDLIGKLTIDLVIKMGTAVGKKVQDVSGE